MSEKKALKKQCATADKYKVPEKCVPSPINITKNILEGYLSIC